MANKPIGESIKARELVDEAVSKNILTVSEIMKYIAENGIVVTQATVNKILREMGYEPQVSYTWMKKEAKGGKQKTSAN